MKAILDALKTRLHSTTAFANVFGGVSAPRIYLDQGPADAVLPLCVYAPQAGTVERMMGGVVRHQFEVEFRFFTTAPQAAALHTAVAELSSALATPLSVTGFDRATLTRVSSGAPSFSDDSWSITERYRVVAFDT